MGWIDQEWVATVTALLRKGDADGLVRRSTAARLRTAGNTGGELLDWVALLGAVGGRPAAWVEADAQPPESPRDAHAYDFLLITVARQGLFGIDLSTYLERVRAADARRVGEVP